MSFIEAIKKHKNDEYARLNNIYSAIITFIGKLSDKDFDESNMDFSNDIYKIAIHKKELSDYSTKDNVYIIKQSKNNDSFTIVNITADGNNINVFIKLK